LSKAGRLKCATIVLELGGGPSRKQSARAMRAEAARQGVLAALGVPKRPPDRFAASAARSDSSIRMAALATPLPPLRVGVSPRPERARIWRTARSLSHQFSLVSPPPPPTPPAERFILRHPRPWVADPPRSAGRFIDVERSRSANGLSRLVLRAVRGRTSVISRRPRAEAS